MFNISAENKPGKCRARRCQKAPTEESLCEKHLEEWRNAGSPPFGGTGAAITVQAALSSEVRVGLVTEKGNAERALAFMQTFAITDQKTMDHAGAFLGVIREHRKVLEEKRDEQIRPIKATLKGVTDLYEPVRKLYADTEALIREKINTHIKIQQEAVAAARLKVEQEQGVVGPDVLVLAHGIENTALPVGMGVRETWHARVTDEGAFRAAVRAGQVPEQFLLIDTDALEAWARDARDAKAAPPGVVFEMRTAAVAARRK